ncbi:MAG: response regulator transcription factor [Pseudomonadota bacterium]
MQITLMAIAWQGQPSAARILQDIESIDRGIAAEAIDLREVRSRLDTCPPDVLLLEFDADRPSATWEILADASRLSLGTQSLLLCDDFSPAHVLEFIRHGASGCLLRACTPEFLAKAVRSVHAGDTWFGRSDLLEALRSQLGASPLHVPADESGDEQLTAREREILKLIGCAMSNKEIARRLQISTATVKTHLHNVYVKLNKSGRYKAFLSEELNPRMVSGNGI